MKIAASLVSLVALTATTHAQETVRLETFVVVVDSEKVGQGFVRTGSQPVRDLWQRKDVRPRSPPTAASW